MVIRVDRFRIRVCRNPHCGDTLDTRVSIPLCPSCRFIGKLGLALGALVAGALMKWLS